MSLQDILLLAMGGLLGVGASLLVAFLPDALRMLRTRKVVRARPVDR